MEYKELFKKWIDASNEGCRFIINKKEDGEPKCDYHFGTVELAEAMKDAIAAVEKVEGEKEAAIALKERDLEHLRDTIGRLEGDIEFYKQLVDNLSLKIPNVK